MKRGIRVVSAVVTAAVTALALTGCSSYRGINSLSLPGTVGTGSDSYQVTMKLDNAVNMVPNTPVLINDINVGTITDVKLDGWTPVLTLSLRNDVKLPANTVAKLGQTSLLGSKHIALSAPADQPPQGVLQAGAQLPQDRASRFPETEEVLSGVSLLLNGGGLQHFQTITTELNRALGGRENDARNFLTQLNNFTAGLDTQKGDIVLATKGLDRLSTTLAPRIDEIENSLNDIPRGLAVIDDQEPALIDTLGSLTRAGELYEPVLHEAVPDLRGVFNEVEPVLRGIADTKPGALMKDLKLLPFVIFPLDSIPYEFRGDFVHIILTLDLTHEALDKAFLTGTPAGGALAAVAKAQRGQLPGLSKTDPLRVPLLQTAPNKPNPVPSAPDGDPLNTLLNEIGG
ncbi:MCE family protein [Pseudonocardia eucalypti]|uniref:MCE family protein n=1 Tax=Pseudonocardia eucalypti TaxID=648755 RepID=A0ABP9QJ73_9PSEU|nr:phospholipid/cholesterol/gamma-HCH transport system substrate-binding protein [Pseudonocardia eucalypti]